MSQDFVSGERSLDARVEKAYLQIEAEKDGKAPTHEEIRKITGGSYRDLGPAIKRVRAGLAERREIAAKTPKMPEEVREKLDAVWQVACQMADAAATKVLQERAAERADWAAERDQFLEALGAVEDERDAARAEAEAAQAQVTELDQALAASEKALHEANARLGERDEIVRLLSVSSKTSSKARSSKTGGRSKGEGEQDEGTEGNEPPLPL